jgi:alpha-L-fucosidase
LTECVMSSTEKRFSFYSAVVKIGLRRNPIIWLYLNFATFVFTSTAMSTESIPETLTPSIIVSTQEEPVARGKFAPTWESLKQYQEPEWFRDAKFGIWAHWGPQCQPEAGDWYARGIYQEGSGQYKHHLAKYGHPSQFGFKDVIHQWQAEKWNPDKLVALYKRVGAQYFFAMANHHDNLDLWNSKHQPWNSVAVGPHKDILAGWAKAAKENGLPFGISVHAAHAWTWYEPAQVADKAGDKVGVAYDGKLTKADGEGQWWDGLDPQDLYAQNHALSKGSDDPGHVHSQWNWGNGASTPDQAYCEKFYNRTADLINKYHPDLIYFDDTALPLWPVSDAGLKIAAHFYNSNAQWHNGDLRAVLFGKILTDEQRKAILWDFERGVPPTTLPFAWQTDTCIGSWHYDRGVYERNGYKSARTVIHMLADIVSKNGNLLLSVPVRGDGSIDEKEERVLEEIAAWMDVNKESIFGTRPWKIFGEGPASEGAALSGQGFNEGQGKPFTADDVRFTTKGKTLYATALGWPQSGKLTIRTLATTQDIKGAVRDVQLLGGPQVAWTRNEMGLVVTLPPQKSGDNAWVLKIQGLDLEASQPVLVAGQTPIVVRPDQSGAFALGAELAELHGGLQTEERGGVTNIGFWGNANDWASWTLDVSQPGVYQVTARLATIHDGAEFVVEVAGQKLEGKAPNTGAWETYQNLVLGKVAFKEAGKVALTIRLRDAAHWKAIDLASIRLDKS